MKRKVVVLGSVLIIGLAVQLAAVAQEEPELSAERILELAHQDIKQQRVELITQAMNLTVEEAAAFWPIYKDYEAQLDKVDETRLSVIADFADSYWSMTDKKAGQLARKVLDLEEQRTKLKRAYFERFEKEMTSVIGARFVQAENQINMLLDLQLASQLPMIE